MSFMLLKLFPLIGSAALLYLVLQKQTFAFQKYTVYTYSVAIDTNIYKETSRLEWNSLEKKITQGLPFWPSHSQSSRAHPAVNSSGLLQNTIEGHPTNFHTLQRFGIDVACCHPLLLSLGSASVSASRTQPQRCPRARAEPSQAPKRKTRFPGICFLSRRLPGTRGSRAGRGLADGAVGEAHSRDEGLHGVRGVRGVRGQRGVPQGRGVDVRVEPRGQSPVGRLLNWA